MDYTIIPAFGGWHSSCSIPTTCSQPHPANLIPLRSPQGLYWPLSYFLDLSNDNARHTPVLCIYETGNQYIASKLMKRAEVHHKALNRAIQKCAGN